MVLAALLAPDETALAADSVNPGTLEAYSTMHSIGVEWNVLDDDNLDSQKQPRTPSRVHADRPSSEWIPVGYPGGSLGFRANENGPESGYLLFLLGSE